MERERGKTHLHSSDVFLAGTHVHRRQTFLELQSVREGLGGLGDADSVERGGAAGSECVHADTLADLSY